MTTRVPGKNRLRKSVAVARLEREVGRAVQMAVDEGHLRKGLDVDQFVFEMLGIVYAYHHRARLLRRQGADASARAAFERLVASSSANA